jgi:hypothetical protein
VGLQLFQVLLVVGDMVANVPVLALILHAHRLKLFMSLNHPATIGLLIAPIFRLLQLIPHLYICLVTDLLHFGQINLMSIALIDLMRLQDFGQYDPVGLLQVSKNVVHRFEGPLVGDHLGLVGISGGVEVDVIPLQFVRYGSIEVMEVLAISANKPQLLIEYLTVDVADGAENVPAPLFAGGAYPNVAGQLTGDDHQLGIVAALHDALNPPDWHQHAWFLLTLLVRYPNGLGGYEGG